MMETFLGLVVADVPRRRASLLHLEVRSSEQVDCAVLLLVPRIRMPKVQCK